ncbi:MAG: hypothetical protein IJQ24_05000 [Synergistaceae bacterium]|nr:hypothetical protein [Synergistaceae bacterium]MBR0185368.1 hypothetical protein [Synergistaceae bacterium]
MIDEELRDEELNSEESLDETSLDEQSHDEQVAEQKTTEPKPRKIRASDFTLEEKESLVERAKIETFAQVARETGIPAAMLYNWSYNFKHNRHMRSKGDEGTKRKPKAKEPSIPQDSKSSAPQDKELPAPQIEQAVKPQKFPNAEEVSIPKRLLELEEETKTLKSENAVLKERVNYLTAQANKLREALSIMTGK